MIHRKRTLHINTEPVKLLMVVSFVAMISGLFFQIIVTNNLALKGNEFNDLRAQKSALTKEVSVLAYEDANLTSLTYLTTKAQALGFIQNKAPLLAINPVPSSSIAVVTNRL